MKTAKNVESILLKQSAMSMLTEKPEKEEGYFSATSQKGKGKYSKVIKLRKMSASEKPSAN